MNHRHAFTLIELMVVIAIIANLAALAVARVGPGQREGQGHVTVHGFRLMV